MHDYVVSRSTIFPASFAFVLYLALTTKNSPRARSLTGCPSTQVEQKGYAHTAYRESTTLPQSITEI